MSVLFKSIKEATRLIARGGSRIRMIIAGILMVFVFVLPMSVGVYGAAVIFGPAEATLLEYAVVYAVAIILILLVTIPAFAMYYTYARRTYSVSKYGCSDIRRRGAYNYFRSLFSGVILFARYALVLIFIQSTYVLSRMCTEWIGELGVKLPSALLLTVFWSVAIVISIAFMWVTNSLFLAPYYYSRGESVFKAIGKSGRTMWRHPFRGELYAIVFTLLFIASLFTFGVLFILWVLPLMTFTYFEYAERMDGDILTEDK